MVRLKLSLRNTFQRVAETERYVLVMILDGSVVRLTHLPRNTFQWVTETELINWYVPDKCLRQSPTLSADP